MTESPLIADIAFTLGPIPVATQVVVTWAIMAVLSATSFLLTRRLRRHPHPPQVVLEMVIGTIEEQVRDTMRQDPRPFVPLIGTLFLFILAANWSSVIPGVHPPTAHLETDAALALVVFGAMIWFGLRVLGPRRYLASFAQPTLIMLPLNIVETFTRSFSMMVRLFGNVMAGVFVIGIVLSLSGLLVPVPLMALDLLTGAVQAYIFSVLATVFIGGAIAEAKQDEVER